MSTNEDQKEIARLRAINGNSGTEDADVPLGAPPKDRVEVARLRDAEDRKYRYQAMRRPVYLAKGPIVEAVLIANLLTAIICAVVYAVLTH